MEWIWVLAKDVGKGGGGSTDEPTVCMLLLPIGLGVAWAMAGDLRRWLGTMRAHLEAGRSLRRRSSERKVQAA